jgi:iron complex outermembrane recepter protein
MHKHLLSLIVTSSTLFCTDLGPIIVIGYQGQTPTSQDINPLKEKNVIKSNGIKIYGDKAKTSIYKTLDIEPGFIVESQDPYGLGKTSARSRGVDNNFMAISLEGVPNYSIRPIGPRQGIYDLENIETIEHYNGALNPNSGSGVGSKAGLINLIFKRPLDNTQGELSLNLGEDDFYKLFLRADTGKIGEYSKAFISVSQANANKWKGTGDLGEKQNLAIGLTTGNDSFPLEIFYSHNEQKQYDFMGLSYEEIQNLNANYSKDYQTNDPIASDYYDYWKTDSKYDDLQLSLKKDFLGADSLIKIYGSKYNEQSDEGNGAGKVDAQRIGLQFDLQYNFNHFNMETGLWMERSWLEKYVRKVSTTQTREHQGWKWLNKNHGATDIISPYISANKNFDKLKLEAGLRYLYYKEAANDTYLGNNLESDYDNAIAKGTIAPGGEVGAMKYHLLLPTLGARYEIDESIDIFAKWGKGYQRPYRYSFAAQYAADKNGLRDKLLAQGKTLESIMESWDMETSDLIDIGIRKYFDQGEITFSLFYNMHNDLLSSAYDPEIDIDYLQNIGEAVIYGAQIQSSIEPIQNLWFFINPALTYSKVKSNINYSSTQYDLQGNEVPETPRFTLKAGTTYKIDNHLLSLNGRYVGERYADIENKEKIDDYATFDFSYQYTFRKLDFVKDLSFQLSLLNLFNEKYISSIGSADILEDTTSFYLGSPRSFAFNMKVVF